MRLPSFLPSTLLLSTALASASALGAAPTGDARATGSTPARSAIYRCEGERGIPWFSQFPCGAVGSARRVDLDALQTVRIVPLGAAERRRLDVLQRERQERLRARDRAQRQARVESARRQRNRIERCRNARARLDALRDERRKGYSVRRAALLERREAELDARIRADC
ncbi:MAG: hypothetical protein RIC56_18740 [Pseudomonadales bacterium]